MKVLSKKLYELVKTTTNSQGKQNTILEVSPARLIADKIYEHSLPAPFFNEYLSQIAQMKIWDKVYSGHQHLYYLNDLILTVNPDGKQTCVIPKLIENHYYIHPEMINMNNTEAECPVTEVLENLKSLTSTETINNIQDQSSVGQENEANLNPDQVSLKCNLRLRAYRPVPISPNRFPPITKYHFRERKVYRTYSNSDVIIHFEILRPMECPKKFENLLLPKPDSKFMIKIWVKRSENLSTYLGVFSENVDFIAWH